MVRNVAQPEPFPMVSSQIPFQISTQIRLQNGNLQDGCLATVFSGGSSHYKSLAWGKNTVPGVRQNDSDIVCLIENSAHLFLLKLDSWLTCML